MIDLTGNFEIDIKAMMRRERLRTELRKRNANAVGGFKREKVKARRKKRSKSKQSRKKNRRE